MGNIRKCDKEFKLKAIKLYLESKKDRKEMAESLGIPLTTLYTWIQVYKVNGDKAF